MLGRRTLFGLSVVATAAVYALLFALAPRIEILHAGVRPERLERFRVYLRDDAQVFQQETPPDPQVFRARPGSVSDLLKMDEAPVPASALESGGADIADLAKRIARDSLPPAPVPVVDTLSRMDAKILEITQEAARRDLEVPRRLVRPSPISVPLIEGTPALREPGAFDSAPSLVLPPSGLPSLLAAGPGVLAEAQQDTAGQPDPSQPLVRLEPIAALPELHASTETIRAPVREAMEETRREHNYAFLDDLLDIELATWNNPGESEGYFQVRIVPKKGESIPVLPKDVTFVVDASSSIPQHKLNTTAKGLREALRQLKAEDRFNIIVFRDSPQAFQSSLVSATRENRVAAEEFIRDLESRGETDVYKALQPVVQQQPREGTPGVVLVVSDGRPTTGIQDGRIIINGLSADNQSGNGIYAFGGGRTVNRYLLDLLAYRNKGVAQVVTDVDSIAYQLPDFFETLRDPILVDLRADFGRIDEKSVFPRNMPDFFQGQAVTLYGRYRPGEEEEFTLWLAGKAGDRKKEVIFRTGFDAATEGSREIAQGWAFQKAYDIIGKISREGETPELLNELKELRAEYGVRTSYDE
jgi:hypothetical protein